ncbi:hypothetical protein [Clostridium grantii]|uniref:Uncharacterized protein n=1 Tax=Clostridium grantii DSM 8605 TaxID=1121316 RepID=A0A1M5VMC9_9CLOT|nr:hypothetical protein [Clostridium grantii]SHH76385.1 hypothetical protein SAMN02745207_02357 [Clostridium grantii DSM 8605]
MNKVFIEKMLKAEMLRYEAIKEILPAKATKQLEKFEKEAMAVVKDIVLDIVKESYDNNEEEKKETKKVEVDFS